MECLFFSERVVIYRKVTALRFERSKDKYLFCDVTPCGLVGTSLRVVSQKAAIFVVSASDDYLSPLHLLDILLYLGLLPVIVSKINTVSRRNGRAESFVISVRNVSISSSCIMSP